jgi:Domain of unknown function (DUF6457)
MDGDASDSDLLQRLASALNASECEGMPLVPLDLGERALLLRIARDVAHASERQNAPLASYLIGRFVQMSMSAGVAESEALARAAAIVNALAGQAPD